MEETIIVKNEARYRLTDRERRMVSILLVEPEVRTRVSMRQALVSLGYEDIADANNAVTAIEKLEERPFTHIIFDTEDIGMGPQEFLTILLRKVESIVAIPAANDPTVDEVFDLLISGAKGCIAKPCTSGALEEAIVWASKGESISDAVLQAANRNEALSLLTLSALSKLALVTKQARTFPTAEREIPRRWAIFKRSIEIATIFTKGGKASMISSLIETAIKRSNDSDQSVKPGRRRRRRK